MSAFGFDIEQRDQSEGEPMEDSADYGDVSFGPLFGDPTKIDPALGF